MKARWIACLLLPACIPALPAAGRDQVPPNLLGDGRIYVALWFDTEDYLLPQSDDAAKRLAEIMTARGIRGTFKIVGEKAAVLAQRDRRDVIAALLEHEIGYHTRWHSRPPAMPVYLNGLGLREGADEFYRREQGGVEILENVFGVHPVCYGQPGGAWAPQVYPALRRMNIPLYLDDAPHVGWRNRPFRYGGILNVFNLGPNNCRPEIDGSYDLTETKKRFQALADRLAGEGGGVVHSYFHPCEWVHKNFWDAVNFSRGADPPRDRWVKPPIRTAAETENCFRTFTDFLDYLKADPRVRFVTASDLLRQFPDRLPGRSFNRDEIGRIARETAGEISFSLVGDIALAPSEIWSLLLDYLRRYAETGALPLRGSAGYLDGPEREGRTGPDRLPWEAFGRALSDAVEFSRTHGRVPDVVWAGSQPISAADFLATAAGVTVSLIESGEHPDPVPIARGNFTAGVYVAGDGPELWRWIIFPENFRAPELMELARLQAWTLKPAIFNRAD